jgi:hypothetical protein
MMDGHLDKRLLVGHEIGSSSFLEGDRMSNTRIQQDFESMGR